MNAYQKAATLVLRLIGCYLAAIGATGFAYLAAMKALGQTVPAYPSERFVASVFWFAGGIILVLFSKLLGRCLGHGLE